MRRKQLLACTLLLLVMPGVVDAFEWTPKQVRAWEAAFPPGEVVVSLPRTAAESDLGQVESLLAAGATGKWDKAVVVVGMKTCAPCRRNWPTVVTEAGARPAVPFFDLASEPEAVDGPSVRTFVQFHLSSGLGFGVPAYVLVDKALRPVSPLTNNLGELLGWLDNPASVPAIDGVKARRDVMDEFGDGGQQLVTMASKSLGEALDAIGKASGASIEASREIRDTPMEVNMGDMPAAQVLNLILPMANVEWAILPARDGRPAVVRLWRQQSSAASPAR